ncbi:hypothetical protein BSR29_07940 [Boudabousia liubingyangii]|uniref:PucR C-terminal helix-turn-helix domain-containing protein n=1 Tax=Boudabousia liubingyangii TaxID=1921764 RepID=A0A1Q5PJQ9_9ACTO|nr:helix-turn-helix domain-containing protein [Boudabousia liubingyangii]OKL46173.1 hypothetical protein BSR29_07940 [Boudabousia liubingyangii]OKL46322.1 hypothetical protein BSR28_07235 [Boudabousia liubingyangii]
MTLRPEIGEILAPQISPLAQRLYRECTTAKTWIGRAFNDDGPLVVRLTQIVLQGYCQALLNDQERLDLSAFRAAINQALQELLVGRSREEFIAYLRATAEQFLPMFGTQLSSAQRECLTHTHLAYTRDLAFWAADYAVRTGARGSIQDEEAQNIAVQALLAGRQTAADKLADLGWGQLGTIVVAHGEGLVLPEQSAAVRRRLASQSIKWQWYSQDQHYLLMLGAEQPILERMTELVHEIAKLLEKPMVMTNTESGLASLIPLMESLKLASHGRTANPQVEQVTSVEELLPEIICLSGAEVASPYLERFLAPMENLDEEYVQTLRAYLSAGADPKLAAKLLYVHANTVRYRITKISKLTGWDLGNPRFNFCLQVALSAQQLGAEGN